MDFLWRYCFLGCRDKVVPRSGARSTSTTTTTARSLDDEEDDYDDDDEDITDDKDLINLNEVLYSIYWFYLKHFIKLLLYF